jgi:threonyl-tRNA synthetase
MLVVGNKFAENGEVGLRKHREGDLGEMPVESVVQRLTAATLDRE